jgi:hypothetical protein
LATLSIRRCVVVVPGIVHEVDAAIDRRADNADSQFVRRCFTDIGTTHSQDGNRFPGSPESAEKHVAVSRLRRMRQIAAGLSTKGAGDSPSQGGAEKQAAVANSIGFVYGP